MIRSSSYKQAPVPSLNGVFAERKALLAEYAALPSGSPAPVYRWISVKLDYLANLLITGKVAV